MWQRITLSIKVLAQYSFLHICICFLWGDLWKSLHLHTASFWCNPLFIYFLWEFTRNELGKINPLSASDLYSSKSTFLYRYALQPWMWRHWDLYFYCNLRKTGSLETCVLDNQKYVRESQLTLFRTHTWPIGPFNSQFHPVSTTQ